MKHLSPFQRKAFKRRVVKESFTLGATKTSRLYCIHRDTIYEWRKSIKRQQLGPKGRVSWQTPVHLERIVVRLRKQTNYGPKRIKYELELHSITLGEKAIRGILERRGLVKKNRKKRRKQKQVFYAPYAGYRLQVDTKAVPHPNRDLRSPLCYQFTAIDIYTKIRFLWIYEELSNHNSIEFLKRALAFYRAIGIEVETVQTDNHMTFTNLFVGGRHKEDHQERRVHPLTEFLLEQGVQHLLSRPGTPTDNAFVERSHRTDGEEFYRTFNFSSLTMKQLNMRLQKWSYNYNFLRPHSSCANLPPLKHYLTVGKTGA